MISSKPIYKMADRLKVKSVFAHFLIFIIHQFHPKGVNYV